MSRTHLVSTNLKTGWSINFPIIQTCNPTPVCEKLCYAKYGRLAMSPSLQRQNQVLKIFQEEGAEALADTIAEGYKKKQLTFLRWNGVGDLTPKICQIINIIGSKYPDQIHWIVTRKPEMVKLLNYNMPNMYIQFSLDGSQDSIERKKTVESLNHPRVYFSFLRCEEDEDTLNASIIFNLQQKKGSLSYNAKCCPVDSGRLPVENACEKCRKCFNPKVFNNQEKNK